MSSGAFTVGPGTIAAANDQLLAPCDGSEGVVFAGTAGLTGTLIFEMSIDGITFAPAPTYATTGGFQLGGSFGNPSAQTYLVAAGAAIKFVRARCSSFTSGSMTITASVDDSDSPALAFGAIANTVTVSSLTAASASTAGAFTRHRGKSSGATTGGVSVKGSAGNLHHLVVSNDQAATKAYLKLYDKATAAVVGTDVPVLTLLVPAVTTVVVPYDLIRHTFTLGITYGIVGLAADSDTTAVAADLVFLTMLYA